MTMREPTIADSEKIKIIFIESRVDSFIDTMPPEILRMAKMVGMNNILKDMARLDNDEIVANCVNDFLDQRNRCMIMEEKGKVIGYCLASTEILNDFGMLKLIIGIGEIFISREYRRKGLGSKLLNAFIDSMYDEEACSIITVLDDQQYNSANVKFFEKNGFALKKLGYKLNLSKKSYKVDHIIRNAVPGDYEGYAKLMIQMYESFKSFDENIYYGTEVVFSQDYYLRELCEPSTLHLVCEIDNEIAGICMFEWRKDDINLHSVSVAEKYAKRGVATSLYHSAFNNAIERGYSAATAVVFAQNEASCKFHEHMMMRPEIYRYEHKTI